MSTLHCIHSTHLLTTTQFNDFEDKKNMRVWRDIDLTPAWLAYGSSLTVRVHLMYQLVQEKDTTKLAHLKAHWEVFTARIDLTKWGSFKALNKNLYDIVSVQGWSFFLSYSLGIFIGPLSNGKKLADQVVDALNAKDEETFLSLFALPDQATVTVPGGDYLTPKAAYAKLKAYSKFEISHKISSGHYTTLSLTIDGKPAMGNLGIAASRSKLDSLYFVV